MAFVQLVPPYHAVFFRYWAATMKAFFLFITFERHNMLIVTYVTKILA